MAPLVDVVGPCPGLGEVEAPPRSRSSLSSKAEVESEPLGRAWRRPSADARAESEPWGRAKRSSSSFGAEPESEPWGQAKRSSSSSGAEPESEPWGRAKRSSSSFGAEPESEPWGRAKRLIQAGVVDAHPKLPIRLGDDDWVGQPYWVMNLFDEANV
jgi:hypothetical protein